MRKTTGWLCSAAIVGAFVCIPVPDGARASDADERLGRFTDALEDDGFAVTPGAVKILNLAEDWCQGEPGVEHAWYTNKAAYLRLLVPTAAGSGDLVQDFQLERNEAIVMLGKTPPREKYFAFHTFVARKVYPDGTKPLIVSAVVDTVNNATIRTAATEDAPFNSLVALIFTPDRRTEERVRAALTGAGYPEAIINTIVVPASMLNLGTGASADAFQLVMRNAIWQDEGAGNSYIQSAPDELRLYRVTAPPCPREVACAPLPMPRLRVRGTGETELYLWNKLMELRARIIAANPGLHATEIPITPAIGYEGYDYMQRAEWVGGDTRDAFILNGGYLPEFGTRHVIKLQDDEFLMAFGANHVATKKATYMNINVYSGEAKDGKLSLGAVDDSRLLGTAAAHLEGDEADLMYAYKISRNCGGEPNCLQVPSKDLELGCPRLKVGRDTVLGIIVRTYLEPATKVGAVMPEVLYDRVLKFSPRKSSPQQ